MKDWIPSDQRPHILGQFKSRKKYSRGKNYQSIQNTLDNPGNPFIEPAQKYKANPKTQRHQDSYQINTNRQPWTIKLEAPGEIPNQS